MLLYFNFKGVIFIKRFRKFILPVFIFSMIFTSSFPTSLFANELDLDVEQEILNTFDEFNNDIVKLIDENVIVENNIVTVKKIYLDKDGDRVESILKYDKLNYNERNSSGNTSTTMNKNIDGWGKASLFAEFDWYKQGMYKYVRCSYASGSFSPENSNITSYISTNRTSDYVSFGKAQAISNFDMEDRRTGREKSTKLVITCDDNGNMSTS